MQTNSRRTLMPFMNGNSSGWWVSIHRNANCYEAPERNLQWRRPTWYMDTHLLKLTLRNTLVYPSINTHLGPHTQCHSQEGQWYSSLHPAKPTQGANFSEDAHIRIPHPPNPWILRCGPRHKQARDGPTPVCPLHIPRDYGRTSSVICHPENSRLGTPSGKPREGPHHYVHNSSWSCWHPGIGPHHTGTCKQKERQCPVPRTIRADFGILARNLPWRHTPVERPPKWGYRSRKHRHL